MVWHFRYNIRPSDQFCCFAQKSKRIGLSLQSAQMIADIGIGLSGFIISPEIYRSLRHRVPEQSSSRRLVLKFCEFPRSPTHESCLLSVDEMKLIPFSEPSLFSMCIRSELHVRHLSHARLFQSSTKQPTVCASTASNLCASKRASNYVPAESE